MAEERRTHHSSRARAVAELESEALIDREDELARRWVIALMLANPLEGLGELPLEELARAAPALCAQTLRAVQSEIELERLVGRGAGSGREPAVDAGELAALCGAREPAQLVEAVEALRGVLWEALLDELREPSARLLADVGDRLAYVCAAMLAASLETVAPGAGARATEPDLQPVPHAPLARGSSSVSTPRGEVVIVDERISADEAPPEQPTRTSRGGEHAEPLGGGEHAGPLGGGEHAGPLGGTRSLPVEPSAEIEIRDERREEGPAAWVSTIGAELRRFERDGAPFAVLLVELVEIERLRRDGPPEQLIWLAGELERALADALDSWPVSVARERPGRCWLLAPGTDRAGADRLAQRLMRELPASGGGSRPSLVVAIGTAICPEDGREPAALAAHADIGAVRSPLSAPRVPASGHRVAGRRRLAKPAYGSAASAPPATAALEDPGGSPSVGVLAALPTMCVAMRTVSVMPSASAAPAVRSQSAPVSIGTAIEHGQGEAVTLVCDLDERAARERPVGDSDDAGGQRLTARGLLAVEPGAEPGGDPGRADVRRRCRAGRGGRGRAAGFAGEGDPVRAQRADGSREHHEQQRVCPWRDMHPVRRLRGELTGSRDTCGASLRPCRADSPQWIDFDPRWVPRPP